MQLHSLAVALFLSASNWIQPTLMEMSNQTEFFGFVKTTLMHESDFKIDYLMTSCAGVDFCSSLKDFFLTHQGILHKIRNGGEGSTLYMARRGGVVGVVNLVQMYF